MYAPPVDLEIIKSVKEAVKIPVIGNGDITDFLFAETQLAGCDSAGDVDVTAARHEAVCRLYSTGKCQGAALGNDGFGVDSATQVDGAGIGLLKGVGVDVIRNRGICYVAVSSNFTIMTIKVNVFDVGLNCAGQAAAQQEYAIVAKV